MQVTNFVDKDQAKNTTVQTVVQLLVAVCKQGTISSEFSYKINQGVRVDMGLSIRLKPREVSDIWTTYGQAITEDNIEEVINHFLHNVMGTATRLVVTLNQAKYHAMTIFQTIGRAMLLHPKLSWHVMEKISPTELINFKNALEAVGGNAYYGFRKDLDVFKSAHFRSLGFLAKEVLVKCDGEDHLNRNRVFEKKPMKYLLLWKIVGQYIEASTADDEASLDNRTAAGNIMYNQPRTPGTEEIYELLSNQVTFFTN